MEERPSRAGQTPGLSSPQVHEKLNFSHGTQTVAQLAVRPANTSEPIQTASPALEELFSRFRERTQKRKTNYVKI